MVVVERLLAAITETERLALAVPDHLRRDRWTHPGPWVMHGVESRTVDEVAHVLMTGRQAEAIAEHIACNDPAAVLRRCASDRKLTELHGRSHETPLPDGYGIRFLCKTCGSGEVHEYPIEWPCDTLKTLAEGYGISAEEEAG